MKKLLVIAQWDNEAGVWVATSDDIPGLVTEAASLDELLKRVLAVAPELLEDNAHHIEHAGHPGDLIDVCIQSQFRLDGARAH
jgi:predicted RNase H-like HicB family nuclease